MVLLTNREEFRSSERAFSSEFESGDPNKLSKNLERIIGKNAGGRKKAVFKVDVRSEKAMKALSRLSGIDSISVDLKDMKLTVIGYMELDLKRVMSKLRETVRHSQILSVGPAKGEGKKEEAMSSWVTQGAGGRKKLLAEKAPMAMDDDDDDDDDDDATFSNIGQLMQRMDISSEAGTSTCPCPLPTQTWRCPAPLYSAQVMVGQDIAKDVMVERKRLLNEQEMSIKRMVELEGLLATQKALLTAERVVLEELIAKDEQLQELNRALELEKLKNAELASSSKENDYFKGVADCRSKILERYPQLDLSWMDSQL